MKFLGLSYCVSAKKMREGIFVLFVFLRLEGKRKVGTYRIRPPTGTWLPRFRQLCGGGVRGNLLGLDKRKQFFDFRLCGFVVIESVM